jgi:iron complex transport system substrate-binding protein
MRVSSAILLSAALLAWAAGAGVAPAGAQAEVAPAGAQAEVAPAGAQAEVAPAGAPARVVSINLCTDQLAMLLAAPGQLISVSYLARDRRSSAMAEAAQGYPVNRSRAEEIFLLAPDLVLGGTFSTPGTVAMLRRMGVRVELLPPAEGFADIAAHLRAIGRLLGQEEKAEAMAAAFEARLAALPAPPPERPRLALYGANGATSGQGGLSARIIDAAGFSNIAADLDLPLTGWLPLERLVLADPDVVLTPARFPGASEAEAILDHPALAALSGRWDGEALTGADWVCGLPQSLDAVERLVDLRLALEGAP